MRKLPLWSKVDRGECTMQSASRKTHDLIQGFWRYALVYWSQRLHLRVDSKVDGLDISQERDVDLQVCVCGGIRRRWFVKGRCGEWGSELSPFQGLLPR